jgi:hypothetical protein
MRGCSSLTEGQRVAAVALFEKGIGYTATARLLDVYRVPFGLARAPAKMGPRLSS